jgi:hypothetical protein
VNTEQKKLTSAEFCYNLNNSRSCYCKDFALQIKRIEDEMKLLQNRMDAHEIDDMIAPYLATVSCRYEGKMFVNKVTWNQLNPP